MKGKKSSVAGAFASSEAKNQQINKIVFACDAGMGSSAMGASVLRNKIKDAGFGGDVVVTNSAINNLKDEYDLLVSHQDLADRAATPTPSAVHVAVDNFMNSPRYDEIVEMIRKQRTGGSATEAAVTEETHEEVVASGVAGSVADSGLAQTTTETSTTETKPQILTEDSIVLGATAAGRDEAIDQAGQLLVRSGSVDESYITAMHDREASVSTFMGNGLAIPHGTNEAKSAINKPAMSFTRYDQPVDWNGKPVTFVIGIAGADGEHLELLQKVAKIFSKKSSVAELEKAQSTQEVLDIFGRVN